MSKLNYPDLKISIIIPVYNIKNELLRCAESVKNQTYKNIEIIFVDDGSTDGSEALCDEIAKTDSRIKVIHQKNAGLSEARNAGIKNATGQYMLFVDGDDVIDIKSCEKFVQVILEERDKPKGTENKIDDIDIIVGDCNTVNEKGEVCKTHRDGLSSERIYSGRQYMKTVIRSGEFKAESWLNLYSVKYWKKNKLRFRPGLLHEDMEIAPRLFYGAKRIKYLGFPFYYYMIRDNSIMGSNKNIDKKIHDSMFIYREWMRFSEKLDVKSRKVFKGLLNKCFIKTCLMYEIEKPRFDIVSRNHILSYPLSGKETMKGLAFCVSPRFYYQIARAIGGL